VVLGFIQHRFKDENSHATGNSLCPSDHRRRLRSGNFYTVTKSEPNEAALWKITLQKMENSLVDTGIFISPLIRFLYSLYAGEVFRSVDGIITGIVEDHKSLFKY